MAIANLPAVEFITSTPSLEQVSKLRLSESTEARISDFLRSNHDGTITLTKSTELDE